MLNLIDESQLRRIKSISLFLSLIILLIFISYLGFFSSLFGTAIGLIAYFASYDIKYKTNWISTVKEDGPFLYLILLLFLFLVYIWYASIVLLYQGKCIESVIVKVYTKTRFATSSTPGVSIPYTAYYCYVSNFGLEVPSNKDLKIGDSIRLLYAPQLINRFARTPPIIIKKKETIFEAVLRFGGFAFISSIVYCTGLFLTWFSSLFSRGLPLLNKKLAGEASKFTRLYYRMCYILSCATFALFVLAIFKSIYNLVEISYIGYLLTTLLLLTILLTSYGEKAFEVSTNILLELKSYNLQLRIKQLLKIITYFTVGSLLLESLINRTKSAPELLLELLNRFFDIDIKDWF